MCFCIPSFFTFAIKPRNGDELCFNESICNELLLGEFSYDLNTAMSLPPDSNRIDLDQIPLSLNDKNPNNSDYLAGKKIVNGKEIANLTIEQDSNIKNDEHEKFGRTERLESKNPVVLTYPPLDNELPVNYSDILDKIIHRLHGTNYFIRYDQFIGRLNSSQLKDELKLNQSQLQYLKNILNKYNMITLNFDNAFKRIRSNSNVKLDYEKEFKKLIRKTMDDTEIANLYKFVYKYYDASTSKTWRVCFI